MISKNLINSYIIKNNNKIKINSKDIKKNDIFLALQGSKYHGNRFISDSIKRGAKYCITDKTPRGKRNINNLLVVESIFKYLIDLSKIKRSLFKGKVIGITGSAGKTTLKETLFFFLNKKYKTSASIKSYNNILGVLITILNLDIKSKYAIFELGTNNFGEIRNLVSLVKPSQIFITNIQPTHLETFKSKKNISEEKSDIFKIKYNENARILYLFCTNPAEIHLHKIAKREKLINIIKFGSSNSDYYIKKIKKIKNFYQVQLYVNKKIIIINCNEKVIYRINNLLFVIAFFLQNRINIDIILKNFNKLMPVSGRGKILNLKLKNHKIKFIDESYNANPDTMKQSIKYLADLKDTKYNKIIILGNMNELGEFKNKFHLEVLKFLEKYRFYKVILCGNLFKSALSNLSNSKNRFIYKEKSKQLFDYVNNNIHNNAILMVKCSNSTEVNKFAKKFIHTKIVRS